MNDDDDDELDRLIDEAGLVLPPVEDDLSWWESPEWLPDDQGEWND